MTDFTPLTTFLCRYSSHQALLRGDDTAGLFHPAPAAGCQHGWHLLGASLSAGHRPGANHSAQHQHNLHHRWVWQPVADSESQFQVCFLATLVCHHWQSVRQPECWVAFSVLSGFDSWLWHCGALSALLLPRKKRENNYKQIQYTNCFLVLPELWLFRLFRYCLWFLSLKGLFLKWWSDGI